MVPFFGLPCRFHIRLCRVHQNNDSETSSMSIGSTVRRTYNQAANRD